MPWNTKQLALREKFRIEAAALVRPGAGARDRCGSFDRGVWQALADTGFFRIHTPIEFGGDGGSVADFAAALEGFTEGGDDFGFVVAVIAQVGLFQGALAKYGSEDQKRQWLPRLADGSSIGCFAITESHAGSDVLRIKTQGRLAGDGLIRISGMKWNVTNAPIADVCLVFGRIPELGEKDITAFIAEVKGPHVKRSDALDLMGNRGTPTGHITFDDFSVPERNVLGGLGHGIDVLYYGFLMERVFGGLALAAYMKPIIDDCLDYSVERRAFGKPIGDFQHIQNRIVRMRVNHDLLASLSYRAVAAISANSDCTVEASIIKMFGADALVECTLDAIKVFGNYGYRRERSFERKCREAIGTTIAGGTAEVHKMIIWREMVQERERRRRHDVPMSDSYAATVVPEQREPADAMVS